MKKLIATAGDRKLYALGRRMGVVESNGKTSPPQFIPSILRSDDWTMIPDKVEKAGNSESVRRGWLKRKALESANHLRSFQTGLAGIPDRFTRAALRQKQQQHAKVISDVSRELSNMQHKKLRDIVTGNVQKHLQGRHDQKDHGRKQFSFASEVQSVINSLPVLDTTFRDSRTSDAYVQWKKDIVNASMNGRLPELAEAWSQGWSNTIREKLTPSTVKTLDALTNDQNSRSNTIVPESQLSDILSEITTDGYYEGMNSVRLDRPELISEFLTPANQAMRAIDSFLTSLGHPAGVLNGLQLDDFRGIDKIHRGVYDSAGYDRNKVESAVVFDDINFSDLSASIGNYLMMYYRDNPEDIPANFRNSIVIAGD